MDVIPPDPAEPELFAWWRPLLAVAQRLREEHEPFTVRPEEFRFRGWVKRASKATLFVYEYAPTGTEVMCDESGRTYGFKWFAANPDKGRLTACRPFDAMLGAGLPMNPLPDPGGYAEATWDAPPSRRRASRPWSRSRARLRLVR